MNKYFTAQRRLIVSRLSGKGYGVFDQKVAVEDVFNVAEAESELERALKGFYQQSLDSTHEIVQDSLGISFELDDVVTRAFLKDAGKQIGNITANTLRIVRRELEQGQAAGEGIDQLAKRLKESAAFSPGRARTIARTELGHASNTAAVYTYRASEIVESVLVFDGEVHPLCAEWNGKVISIEQMASVPTLAHPNCVRAFGPIPKATEIPKPKPAEKPIAGASEVGSFNSGPITVVEIEKAEQEQRKKLNKWSTKIREENLKAIENRLTDNPEWQRLAKVYAKKGSKNPTRDVMKMMSDIWDETSTDNPVMIALHRAVSDELRLKKAATEHFKDPFKKEGDEIYKAYGEGLKAYARAQYEVTQQYLRAQGLTEIYSYRGMKFDTPPKGFKYGDTQQGQKTEVSTQPISSFSWNGDTAITFARGINRKQFANSALVGTRIPADRVFSIPQTGPGVLKESELTVLGGTDISTVVTWNRMRADPNLNQIKDELAKASTAKR